MRRRILQGTVAVVLGAIATVATLAADRVFAASRRPPPSEALVDVVRVDIEHSRFVMPPIAVRQGSTVRFLVSNGDPIAHEFVLGDAEVHRRHEVGVEARHPPVPGEVTVGAGEERATIYTFDDVGTVRFACHLPGHLAYGMVGEVTVVAAGAG